MKERICLLLFAASTLFFGCKTPQALVYQDVKHIALQKASLQEVKLSGDVQLYNPNNFAVKLKKADIDVYVNAIHAGKVSVAQKTLIARRDTFLLPVVVAVDMKNVLPNALQLLVNKDIMLRLTGAIKAGKHGVYISVPVNYDSKLDIGL
jgi:LEA14-like dessication related protein